MSRKTMSKLRFSADQGYEVFKGLEKHSDEALKCSSMIVEAEIMISEMQVKDPSLITGQGPKFRRIAHLTKDIAEDYINIETLSMSKWQSLDEILLLNEEYGGKKVLIGLASLVNGDIVEMS